MFSVIISHNCVLIRHFFGCMGRVISYYLQMNSLLHHHMQANSNFEAQIGNNEVLIQYSFTFYCCV